MAFTTVTRPTTSYQNLSRPATSYAPINELGVAILAEDDIAILSEDGARILMEEQIPTVYTLIQKPA